MGWLSKPQRRPIATLDLRGAQLPAKRANRLSRRAVIFYAALAVGALAAALLAWLYWGSAARGGNLDSVEVIVQRVNRHYILPTGEQPALATVTDNTKLTTQFLKKASNGDKVLIYQKNRLAVIYRPSADRIVAVGPVTIDNPPPITVPPISQ